MSGAFDDNPFAAPNKSNSNTNPIDNPFADPSVEQARSSGTAPPGLDEYNPFDKQQQKTQPAVMNTSSSPAQEPPKYTASGQQQVTSADFQELQRRQEELERRAKELERREAELRNAPYNARANNWPPLPSFIPVQPCFYHDISVDIPVEFQKIVTYLYYLWIAHVGVMVTNMLLGLLFIFAGGDIGQSLFLAMFVCAILTPASFVCWYRPVYKAFRDDSSFSFMVFFFVFFFQFIISVFSALGIGDTTPFGLFSGLNLLNTSTSGKMTFVALLILVASIVYGLIALADFLMLTRVHKLYRSTGASLAKAQAEFASGVMKNETVQKAAAEAAKQSVQNTFANQNTGQQGNRY